MTARTLGVAMALLLWTAAPVYATSVAYVDGGQIWVASTDGGQKRSLSGPSDNAQTWSEVAQSDDGHILGVRRELGKISTLNSTRLWAPDGSVAGNGALTAKPGRTVYAFPTALDLSPNGKTVVYGYSNTTGFGLSQTFEQGTYVEGSTDWYIEPFAIADEEDPSLAGNRLVTIPHGPDQIDLQRADGQPPFSTDFDPWTAASLLGLELQRADVAATGTVAAIEFVAWTGGTRTTGKIAVFPISGLGGTFNGPASCFLPAQGVATDVSLSQDAKLVAWKDDRGVVVAGMPDFSGVDTCTLTAPPVVISATGSMPSLGPATAAAAPTSGGDPAGGQPTGGSTTMPTTSTAPATPGTAPTTPVAVRTVSLAARVTTTALGKGLAVRITVTRAGRITVTGKVGGTVVVRGSATASRAGTITVRVKATRAAKRRLKRLKGKRLVLSVRGPGVKTSVTRTLR